MKAIIRKAKKEDLEEIGILAEKFEKETFDMINKNNKYHCELEKTKKSARKVIEKDIRNCLKKRNFQVLVATDNGRIIGYMTYSIRKNPGFHKLSRYGRLNFAFIEKEYRKQEIFSLFVKEAKKWFKEKNIKVITLQTIVSNRHALGIYKKMGFKEMSVEMVGVLK